MFVLPEADIGSTSGEIDFFALVVEISGFDALPRNRGEVAQMAERSTGRKSCPPHSRGGGHFFGYLFNNGGGQKIGDHKQRQRAACTNCHAAFRKINAQHAGNGGAHGCQ